MLRKCRSYSQILICLKPHLTPHQGATLSVLTPIEGKKKPESPSPFVRMGRGWGGVEQGKWCRLEMLRYLSSDPFYSFIQLIFELILSQH